MSLSDAVNMLWGLSQNTRHSEGRREGGEGGEEEESQNNSDGHSLDEEEEEMSEGWDRTVHTHLMALAVSPVETLWPKDSLFRYWSSLMCEDRKS